MADFAAAAAAAAEAHERDVALEEEAAIYVLTAHVSQIMDIPIMETLFLGPDGRKHILANIHDDVRRFFICCCVLEHDDDKSRRQTV